MQSPRILAPHHIPGPVAIVAALLSCAFRFCVRFRTTPRRVFAPRRSPLALKPSPQPWFVLSRRFPFVSHGPQSEPRPSPLPWPRSPRRALGSCSRSVFVSFVLARASNGTSPLARAVAARAPPQPWHVFRVVFFLFPRRPQTDLASRLGPGLVALAAALVRFLL